MSLEDFIGRSFTLAQARDFVENAEGLSRRQQRNVEAWLESYEAKWAGHMREQYEPVANRSAKEAEDIARIAGQIEEMLDEVLDDMRNNRISPQEAAKTTGAGRRDLANLAKARELTENSEGNTWEQIDIDPADYQEAVSKRFPVLFRPGGPGLAVLTPDVLNGR
jgi:DNA-binding protein H-NS